MCALLIPYQLGDLDIPVPRKVTYFSSCLLSKILSHLSQGKLPLPSEEVAGSSETLGSDESKFSGTEAGGGCERGCGGWTDGVMAVVLLASLRSGQQADGDATTETTGASRTLEGALHGRPGSKTDLRIGSSRYDKYNLLIRSTQLNPG